MAKECSQSEDLCFTCGKPGHRASECKSGGNYLVQDLGGASRPGQPCEPPSWVGMVSDTVVEVAPENKPVPSSDSSYHWDSPQSTPTRSVMFDFDDDKEEDHGPPTPEDFWYDGNFEPDQTTQGIQVEFWVKHTGTLQGTDPVN